jgi:hypothetical protein
MRHEGISSRRLSATLVTLLLLNACGPAQFPRTVSPDEGQGLQHKSGAIQISIKEMNPETADGTLKAGEEVCISVATAGKIAGSLISVREAVDGSIPVNGFDGQPACLTLEQREYTVSGAVTFPDGTSDFKNFHFTAE